MEFSAAQQRAINHDDGPLLVIAGPGSGKTTVIVHRAARLIRQKRIPPENLMVVTFSAKAAAEMRTRAQAELADLKDIQIGKGHFTTIHSLAFQIIGRFQGRPNVLGESVTDRLLRDILNSRDLYDLTDPESLQSIKSDISFVRGQLLDLSDPNIDWAGQSLPRAELRDLLQDYGRKKIQLGGLDFDDLIDGALHILSEDRTACERVQNRLEHLMLDEAQDASPAQFRLIRTAALPQNNLAVVGDEDQSIYSFRGADPRIMLSFSEWYPNAAVIKLTRNYRSPDNLVRISQKVIRHNTSRFPKNLKGDAEINAAVETVQPADEQAEAGALIDFARRREAFDKPGQLAALYRANYQAVPVIGQLVDQGLPFLLLAAGGSSVFHQSMMEDMLAFLRLSDDPLAPRTADILRLANKPNRYIKRAPLTALAEQLPGPDPRIWDLALGRPEWSPAQRDALLKLRDMLAGHAEKHGSTSDQEKLNALLNKPFHYGDYLSMQAGDDQDREKIYRRRFRILQSLARHNDFRDRVARIRKAVEQAGRRRADEPGLVLATCHAAKGLEWNHVWVLDALDGVFPSAAAVQSHKSDDPGALEEERRLFYVACTRAVKSLTISAPRRYADNHDALLSPFVVEGGFLSSSHARVKSLQASKNRDAARKTKDRQGAKPRPIKTPAAPRHAVGPAVRNQRKLRPGLHLIHANWGPVTVLSVSTGDGIVEVLTGDGDRKGLHMATCFAEKLLGYGPKG